ncbi:MAG TPA: tetratricopeptide repeat protein [bacterium]|nr:tetratricopeptide repeat protein [bacterium]
MNTAIHEKITRGETLSTEELRQLIENGGCLKDAFHLTDSDLTSLMMIGYELFNQGKYDDARVIFQGLEALGHDDPFVYTALGTIAARKNELEMAHDYFNRAIDGDPEDMVALTNRAEVFLKQNCFEEAASDLQKAIELDPDEESALSSRARVLAMVTRELMESVQESA